MASRQRNTNSQPPPPRRRPASTPEARENQLIDAAVNLAERQLQEGSASAQVITHYLKLGSTRESLEQERLRRENALLEGKLEQLQSAKRVEELYDVAIKAMRQYAGHPEPLELDAGDDYDNEFD